MTQLCIRMFYDEIHQLKPWDLRGNIIARHPSVTTSIGDGIPIRLSSGFCVGEIQQLGVETRLARYRYRELLSQRHWQTSEMR